jgi:predicted nucleic acid-binding Zn ribbon protein
LPEPVKISALIKSEREKLWKNSPGLGMQSLWEQVSGAEISAHTRVRSLRKGVLTVSCNSSGWACELTFAASDLAARLNDAGPPEKISELRFVHQAQTGRKSSK